MKGKNNQLPVTKGVQSIPSIWTAIRKLQKGGGRGNLNNDPKVYRFLISQQSFTQTEGLLTIGQSYIIAAVNGDDDFTNVGFAGINISFVATDTTPTAWVDGTSVLNLSLSMPTTKDLENTLGEVSWSHDTNFLGRFYLTLSGAFPLNKVFSLNHSTLNYDDENGNVYRLFIERLTNDVIAVSTIDDFSEVLIEGALLNKPIEILVYPILPSDLIPFDSTNTLAFEDTCIGFELINSFYFYGIYAGPTMRDKVYVDNITMTPLSDGFYSLGIATRWIEVSNGAVINSGDCGR